MTQDNKEQLLQLLQKHKELGISEQIDYEKFYLYSIITHSTAIEGSTVTEVETQLLFDEGITAKGKPMIEQLMNLDLKAAYDYGRIWIMKHEDITTESLITLAAKVMARTGGMYNALGGSFDASKGELRKLNVTAGAGGRSYMNWMKVPMKLETFCKELNACRRSIAPTDIAAIYDLSFWAHYGLVTIHPWADGNGRTSRLLMNLLQMEYGVLPTKVLKEDKAEYIQALIDAREEEDDHIFFDCMARLHIANLKHDIDQFTASVGTEVVLANVDGDKKDDAVNVAVNIESEITERQKDILKIISGKSSADNKNVAVNVAVNTKLLAERLGLSRKTIQRELNWLRERGLIRWVGADKNGHWEIEKDNHNNN